LLQSYWHHTNGIPTCKVSRRQPLAAAQQASESAKQALLEAEASDLRVRWEVAQRQSAERTRVAGELRKARGVVDDVSRRIANNHAGTEKGAREHSGGEKVIIGEAVSLALSMMACWRAGLEGVTLVRDESGAALDPQNARTNVAMLRRAAAVTNADRVLFVSHSKEVVEMADARIEVTS
jgi:ABC-type iron transport system FetAB ATPase subunit